MDNETKNELALIAELIASARQACDTTTQALADVRELSSAPKRLQLDTRGLIDWRNL